MPLKGSCLCSSVTYEVTDLDMPIGHCSCRTCRKAHASAFTSTAGVLRENFRILRGAENLGAFESSPGKTRHFCRTCGSHLFAERPTQGHIILRVATLDDDPGVTPQVHIWRSHEVSWLSFEDIESFEAWPPGR